MKKVLPMLALRGKYIYPNSVIHFDVSRSKSVRAIEEAMQNDQMIFLDNQIDPAMEDPKSLRPLPDRDIGENPPGSKTASKYYPGFRRGHVPG